LSNAFIFRSGTVTTQPFSSSLGEIGMLPPPPKNPTSRSASLRQQVLDQERARGFQSGRDEGFAEGRSAGYQAGFDEAYSEASNEQAERLREFATGLQTVQDRLQESITEWFQQSEVELEAIAVEIAQKLVGAQLNLDRSFIIETTKAALQRLTEASTARIRLNPFDAVILSNAREELLSATASLRGIEIVEDSSIYGGCIIETERGAVDATIETRLELLEGGLEEAA
jgi:flagellar assembly protein FliH